MNLFDLPRPFVYGCIFVLGCCFGSFLNVCIHRFPSRYKLWDQLKALNSSRSGCPKCGAAIQWRDNIPLLGWLMLAGKCRNCRRPISFRYPFVELLTGLLFVLMYWIEMPPDRYVSIQQAGLYTVLGPQNITDHLSPDVWLHLRYSLHMMMICCLIVATFIDFELRIIPEACTDPWIVVAILASTAVGQCFIVPLWFQDLSVANILREELPSVLKPLMFYWDAVEFAQRHPHLHGFLTSLAGFCMGYGVVWFVRTAGSRVLRQEAMGEGDVWLMAMIGSVIGWQPVLIAFFIAPLLAIASALITWLVRGDRYSPYGPWLSMATVLVLVGWPTVWPAAKRIFDMGPALVPIAVFMMSALVVSLQLTQLIKRILGFPLYYDEEEPTPEWSSADHLTYYNAERPDEQTGQWQVSQWPGCRAGRGLSQSYRWRHDSR
ncbi:MAG: prepilin peptidase [Planctomycetaceae bacterium]|nr:prepilin peptidase [Planctomycetaceae bacterium]